MSGYGYHGQGQSQGHGQAHQQQRDHGRDGTRFRHNGEVRNRSSSRHSHGGGQRDDYSQERGRGQQKNHPGHSGGGANRSSSTNTLRSSSSTSSLYASPKQTTNVTCSFSEEELRNVLRTCDDRGVLPKINRILVGMMDFTYDNNGVEISGGFKKFAPIKSDKTLQLMVAINDSWGVLFGQKINNQLCLHGSFLETMIPLGPLTTKGGTSSVVCSAFGSQRSNPKTHLAIRSLHLKPHLVSKHPEVFQQMPLACTWHGAGLTLGADRKDDLKQLVRHLADAFLRSLDLSFTTRMLLMAAAKEVLHNANFVLDMDNVEIAVNAYCVQGVSHLIENDVQRKDLSNLASLRYTLAVLVAAQICEANMQRQDTRQAETTENLYKQAYEVMRLKEKINPPRVRISAGAGFQQGGFGEGESIIASLRRGYASTSNLDGNGFKQPNLDGNGFKQPNLDDDGFKRPNPVIRAPGDIPAASTSTMVKNVPTTSNTLYNTATDAGLEDATFWNNGGVYSGNNGVYNGQEVFEYLTEHGEPPPILQPQQLQQQQPLQQQELDWELSMPCLAETNLSLVNQEEDDWATDGLSELFADVSIEDCNGSSKSQGQDQLGQQQQQQQEHQQQQQQQPPSTVVVVPKILPPPRGEPEKPSHASTSTSTSSAIPFNEKDADELINDGRREMKKNGKSMTRLIKGGIKKVIPKSRSKNKTSNKKTKRVWMARHETDRDGGAAASASAASTTEDEDDIDFMSIESQTLF